MPDKYTQETLDTSQNIKMPQNSTQKNYQTFNAYVQDFLANHFHLLDKGEGSKIQEVRSFLKSYGLLGKNNHLFYSLKTSKGYYLTTKGKPIEQSSPRWMKWGMTHHSNLLTANISFRRTGIEYSLSDILEDQVEEKYFLSDKMVSSMQAHEERHKSQGNSLRSDIVQLSLQATTKDGEQEEQ